MNPAPARLQLLGLYKQPLWLPRTLPDSSLSTGPLPWSTHQAGHVIRDSEAGPASAPGCLGAHPAPLSCHSYRNNLKAMFVLMSLFPWTPANHTIKINGEP